MELRQSAKVILLTYAICAVLEIAIVAYWLTKPQLPFPPLYLLAIPLFIQLWAAVKHLLRFSTKLTVTGDRLRYESGLLSKSTRVMELLKVQDVRVDQSLMQRIINVGNLSVETAGESSRIVMPSIDRPHEVAERVLHLSHSQRIGGDTPK